MEEPPTSTMFLHCGNGKTAKKKPVPDDTLSQAITQIAQRCHHKLAVGPLLMGQALLNSLTAGSKWYRLEQLETIWYIG